MRVLIAYDGGEAGEKALAAIAPWAIDSGAEVHMVKVLKPKEIHETAFSSAPHTPVPAGTVTGVLLGTKGPTPHLAEDRSQALVSAREIAEEQLSAVGVRVFGSTPVTVHVEIADHDAADAIISVATKLGAAVIAIGTHGRTGLQHAILGSVAEAVVRRSPVPVLVVGPHVG